MFLPTLALVSAVIVVSALLSGLVERSGLPQVAVFLVMGALIGPFGLGWMDVGVGSPMLRVVATLALALILFTDAVSLNLKEVREHRGLAMLVLGPGTLLSAALVALAGWLLLGLSGPHAAILGAALASTDPVLLRGLLRRQDLDPGVRQALRMESGMNDALLLPVVLVSMELLRTGAPLAAGEWPGLVLRMFVLGPAAGVAVALVAVGALSAMRKRIGVRRDYESIYSLGVAFAAYAGAEYLHASGFLAAFAAGLTIAWLDVELCDCFLEYGETTAEMALLITFVLFGCSLIWSGFGIASVPVLLFVAAVFAARPLAFVPSLFRTRLRWRNRLLLAWFGPRGLSSLLLVLLPVFEGIPQSTYLLEISCLVVLCSVVLHGGSPVLIGRGAKSTPAPAAGSMTLDELKAERERVVVLDVRSARSFEESTELAEGAIRIDPDRAVAEAGRLGLPRDATLVAFCA